MLLGQRVSIAVCDCDYKKKAHLTRSKTVTRLPTGDSRHVPSGLKQRFPLLYTVPSRLENWMLRQLGSLSR